MRSGLVRLLILFCTATSFAQEITLEEVRVEGAFTSPFEFPLSKSIDQWIERLRLKDENARAFELREANKSSLTTLLNLTRYSPIGLGASDPRVDTFFQQNYMRADLNPRPSNPLSLPK